MKYFWRQTDEDTRRVLKMIRSIKEKRGTIIALFTFSEIIQNVINAKCPRLCPLFEWITRPLAHLAHHKMKKLETFSKGKT